MSHRDGTAAEHTKIAECLTCKDCRCSGPEHFCRPPLPLYWIDSIRDHRLRGHEIREVKS